MTSSLSGKAIVVTGAFGALGASTARTLAANAGYVGKAHRNKAAARAGPDRVAIDFIALASGLGGA
jgi:NAD(P)-dependent dehydrogenase (short-subunit alcohol dehydrogenase family)